MSGVNREDARRWKSPTHEDTAKRPDPTAIVRILKRATEEFEQPLGTTMVLERRTPFELLVSTICSAQARDTQTAPIMRELFAVAHTPEQFVRMPLAQLRKLLYPVSYYNTKAKHIRETAKAILAWRREHRRTHERDKSSDGRRQICPACAEGIPTTMEELLQLPGVGRKTANLVLNEGFGKVEGICVDTHVHRISNRLGVVRSRSRVDTETRLMKVLPRKFWAIWNPLLVMWGQNICTPVSPRCSICPLQSQCPRRGVTTSR